jgi:hypothetical protein
MPGRSSRSAAARWSTSARVSRLWFRGFDRAQAATSGFALGFWVIAGISAVSVVA